MAFGGKEAMNESTMETLAGRLDRVERENRRLKQAGVVALAVIAAVVLMGQATGGKVAKVVEAEKFVLKDKDGKIRAIFGLAVGHPVLTHPLAPHLSFYDKQSKPRIKLALDIDGTPELLLGDKKRAYAHLYLKRQGYVWLEMVGMKSRAYGGKELKEDSSIWMSAGYDPFMTFFNSGRGRMKLGGRDGTVHVFGEIGGGVEINPSSLRILDRSWNVRAVLGSISLKITQPGVAGGKAETVEKRPESSLVLFDKKHRVIWSAPKWGGGSDPLGAP